MRRLVWLTVIIIVLNVLALNQALCSGAEKNEMSPAAIAVRPALIRIQVVITDYDQGRESRSLSSGSGVIISPEGYAVTNYHVTDLSKQITCTLADKTEVDAKLIAADPLADISVIKLDNTKKVSFPFADFGDSSKLEVGDRIYAMGCPLAISQSVTMGIVSNVEMVMPDRFGPRGFQLAGEDVGSIVRWIGHDALIEPGNSGGPLVNDDGKIVGINEISFGLAGAIPSNLVKQVTEDLIKNGKVKRAWIGISVQPMLQSSLVKNGVLVSSVMADSPAMTAGFKSGDIIINLADKDVNARFKEEIPLFNLFVAGFDIGKAYPVKVLRNGAEVTLNITPLERPKAMDIEQVIKNWGMCALNISSAMKREIKLESQNGVLVTSVLPSGPAGSAKPSVQENDVITKINGDSIDSIKSLKEITAKYTDGKELPVPLVIDFKRNHEYLTTVVSIGETEESDAGVEVSKAWLPIETQVLTSDIAKMLGAVGRTGVRVTRVYKGTSAEKAGIKVGDLIVSLDSEDIPAEQIGDEEVFPGIIRQYDIGVEVKLGIIRDSKPVVIKAVLEKTFKPNREYTRYNEDNFGFTVRDLSFTDRADEIVSVNENGVYVDSVEMGSWASLGDLKSGDVVMMINDKPTPDMDTLKKIMQQIEQAKPITVVLRVKRGIYMRFVEIKPIWQEN